MPRHIVSASFLLCMANLASAQTTTPNFYLLCQATTGQELNESTQLQCDDSMCIDLSLKFEVALSPKASSLSDSCRLVRTETPGLIDERSQFYVPYVEHDGAAPVIGKIVAPGMGRLFPGDTFEVEFPEAGTYSIQVTRGRASMRFIPVKN